MTFYHGGTPGLAVGTTLVPRPDLADAVAYERAWTLGLDPLRKQRVYFTDSLGWAWVYARFYEERFGVPGAVYEVRPCGKIEKDTSERATIRMFSALAGIDVDARCYRAPSAVILGVQTTDW